MGPAFGIVTRDDLSLWLSGATRPRGRCHGRRRSRAAGTASRSRSPTSPSTVTQLLRSGRLPASATRSWPAAAASRSLVEDRAGNPIELFEARQ